MKTDKFSTNMLLLVAAVTAALFIEISASPRQIDALWTCPQQPVACIPPAPANRCERNADCPIGDQCCYRGCVKRCISPDPCRRVACKPGYLCRNRETPCSNPPCQLQGSCIPEKEVLCTPPVCQFSECEPGYERATDSSGCPTCRCVEKPKCGPNCFNFCARGYELDALGCPTCRCKPEPANPCSEMVCSKDEECRFVDVPCTKAPCPPTAMCLPRILAPYENACSLTDPTTIGLPVLTSAGQQEELDCFSQICPDNTKCTALGPSIHRCCWQASQAQVFKSPKIGECPQIFMMFYSRVGQTCQVDGQCPDDTKCCYMRTNVESSKAFGQCLKPIHDVLDNAPEACEKSALLKIVLGSRGIC